MKENFEDLPDLDFTKAEDKREDLLNKLDAVNRGITLAEKLNDTDRVLELTNRRIVLEKTLDLLEEDDDKKTQTQNKPNGESYDWIDENGRQRNAI